MVGMFHMYFYVIHKQHKNKTLSNILMIIYITVSLVFKHILHFYFDALVNYVTSDI